jgi:hypothetical protein
MFTQLNLFRYDKISHFPPPKKKKKKNDGIKNILERDGGDDCTRM